MMGRGFSAKTEIISQTAFNHFYQDKANSSVQWLLGLEKGFGDAGWSATLGPSLSLIRGSGTPLAGVFLGVSSSGKILSNGHREKTDDREAARELTLTFRKRSATLTPESKEALREVAALYSKRKKRLFVEADAYGKKANQLMAPLFRKRIANIRSYLSQQGVREEAILIRSDPRSESGMNYRQVVLRIE